MFELFYSGLVPYKGHVSLGFMSSLETYPSFRGSGTTACSHRWHPSRVCAEYTPSQHVGTLNPLRVLNSSLTIIHLVLSYTIRMDLSLIFAFKIVDRHRMIVPHDDHLWLSFLLKPIHWISNHIDWVSITMS